MAGPGETIHGAASPNVTNLITMTKGQLDEIIATMIRTAGTTSQKPSHATTKDLKIAEPNPFTGKPEDLKSSFENANYASLFKKTSTTPLTRKRISSSHCSSLEQPRQEKNNTSGVEMDTDSS
jgi:hypothetical protein